MTTPFRTYQADSWLGPVTLVRFADPDFSVQRPKGRVRGQRRYYRVLQRDAARFAVPRLGNWYDYMHWHVDWRGLGNTSWLARRAHLDALFTTFRRVLAQTAEWSDPHQVWLQVDAMDSSQDAVYLHTPNPNKENYPNAFDGVDWNAPVPERLQAFLVGTTWEFGRIDSLWTHFLVRP